jgi:hypothetical protein
LTPNPQEDEHETHNTLDIEFLDQLGTNPQNDNSKNDLGVGEQEEEIHQLEIDISMNEPPTNVNPLPTYPSRTKTPPSDEYQKEAKSPEHTKVSPAKELREPAMDHLYTTGSLGCTLSWGDQ